MIDENKIKELCTKDLQKGFKLLMDNYQEPIYHYVRRLLVSHEDAQDALQETFIKVYKNWSQFRGESSIATWIYRIATNESLRILELRKRDADMSYEDIQSQLTSQLMESEYVDYENEMVVKFQAAILALPERQRLVFNLRYYDELEYEEIAKILDSKVETLKVNYHYAKEKIKNYIRNS